MTGLITHSPRGVLGSIGASGVGGGGRLGEDRALALGEARQRIAAELLDEADALLLRRVLENEAHVAAVERDEGVVRVCAGDRAVARRLGGRGELNAQRLPRGVLGDGLVELARVGLRADVLAQLGADGDHLGEHARIGGRHEGAQNVGLGLGHLRLDKGDK
jgi:hypothetical protein